MQLQMMQCSNCPSIKPYNELPKAKDLHERLELGEPYTDVECAVCGCLCHLLEASSHLQQELDVLRQRAQDKYGSTEIEIDRLTSADLSVTDDGTWVRAWVWISKDETEEATRG